MTTTVYNKAKRNICKGTNPRIDLDDANAGAFKAILLTSSYTPDFANNEFLSNISANEVAGGTGYARVSLTGVSWTETGGVAKWDTASPIAWTASGGSIAARYMVIFYDGASPGNDGERELLLCVDFGSTQTAGAGTQLVVNVNAAGHFTIT
jgi:hypothetical protein